MKIVIIGASGTIGSKVTDLLAKEGHQIIKVGKTSGDYQADLEDAASIAAVYKKVQTFDAVVITAGDIVLKPFKELTAADWQKALSGKLLGQINAVQQALPYITQGGSFTLTSGILSDETIRNGVAAGTINTAINGFVKAAAFDLPKGLRINVVSPNLLEESAAAYGAAFPGFIPVAGAKVAQSFKKSVLGVETGKVYTVY